MRGTPILLALESPPGPTVSSGARSRAGLGPRLPTAGHKVLPLRTPGSGASHSWARGTPPGRCASCTTRTGSLSLLPLRSGGHHCRGPGPSLLPV